MTEAIIPARPADQVAYEAEVDKVLFFPLTHRQKLRGQNGFPKPIKTQGRMGPRCWRRDAIVAWLRQEYGDDFPDDVAGVEATFLRPKKEEPSE